jgi:nuclear GTP-binding protein
MGKDNEDILVLKNIIKIKDVVDPQGTMNLILKKTNKMEMLKLYKIADYSDSHEFLCNVAMARGKLKKGGIPDLETAAQMVL